MPKPKKPMSVTANISAVEPRSASNSVAIASKKVPKE